MGLGGPRTCRKSQTRMVFMTLHLNSGRAILQLPTISIKQMPSCLQQPFSGFGTDFKSPGLIKWLWNFKVSHQTQLEPRTFYLLT